MSDTRRALLNMRSQTLGELERRRPGCCLIDPRFFERSVPSLKRSLGYRPDRSDLLLEWGGQIFPIRGQELITQLCRVIWAWDVFGKGREGIPETAFWVDMTVRYQKNKPHHLLQCREGKAPVSTLTSVKLGYHDTIRDPIAILATAGDQYDRGAVCLLLAGEATRLESPGKSRDFADLCALDSPH